MQHSQVERAAEAYTVAVGHGLVTRDRSMAITAGGTGGVELIDAVATCSSNVAATLSAAVSGPETKWAFFETCCLLTRIDVVDEQVGLV